MNESIKSLQRWVFENPKVQLSTLSYESERAFEQDEFYKEWKIDCGDYKKEVKTFESNIVKAYAMIWKNYCGKDVQSNIEEISDFKTRIKKRQKIPFNAKTAKKVNHGVHLLKFLKMESKMDQSKA